MYKISEQDGDRINVIFTLYEDIQSFRWEWGVYLI